MVGTSGVSAERCAVDTVGTRSFPVRACGLLRTASLPLLFAPVRRGRRRARERRDLGAQRGAHFDLHRVERGLQLVGVAGEKAADFAAVSCPPGSPVRASYILLVTRRPLCFSRYLPESKPAAPGL